MRCSRDFGHNGNHVYDLHPASVGPGDVAIKHESFGKECAKCGMIPGAHQPACSKMGDGRWICFKCGYLESKPPAIPMLLWCPDCGERHIDGLALDGTDWSKKAHHTHACQACGHVWRPAIIDTYGVRFLPGLKNEGGP